MAKRITKTGKHTTRKAPSAGWAALAGTEAEFERARRALMRRDARLAPLIKTHRPLPAAGRPHAASVRGARPRDSLAAAVGQGGRHDSRPRGRARSAGRDCLTAERLLAADPAALRAAGVSGPKITYLRDLAERVVDGRLDLHALDVQSDEEVIAAHHRRQRPRALVGRDVPDVPPESPRHLSASTTSASSRACRSCSG